jgi:dimethylaniline monooxygenase (N-oxide forming)
MIKPNVKEFAADGHSVTFVDGSRIDHIDCIIMATGFDVAFPYVNDKILSVHDNHVGTNNDHRTITHTRYVFVRV